MNFLLPPLMMLYYSLKAAVAVTGSDSKLREKKENVIVYIYEVYVNIVYFSFFFAAQLSGGMYEF